MLNMLRTYLRALVNAFVKSERGATAVEYGIMVALIAVIIIAAVAVLGTNLRDVFQNTADTIAPVAP